MKLGRRILFLLALVGVGALIARAGVTTTSGNATAGNSTSSSVADPHYILNSPDPTCPEGVFCVDLVYTGPDLPVDFYTISNPLLFLVPNPPGFFPVPPAYTCQSNIFTCSAEPPETPEPPPGIFLGYEFYNNTVPICGGQDVTESCANGPTTFIAEIDTAISFVQPANYACVDASQCVNGNIVFGSEPGTALLLLCGLLLIFLGGFARKRFGARVVA